MKVKEIQGSRDEADQEREREGGGGGVKGAVEQQEQSSLLLMSIISCISIPEPESSERQVLVDKRSQLPSTIHNTDISKMSYSYHSAHSVLKVYRE